MISDLFLYWIFPICRTASLFLTCQFWNVHLECSGHTSWPAFSQAAKLCPHPPADTEASERGVSRRQGGRNLTHGQTPVVQLFFLLQVQPMHTKNDDKVGWTIGSTQEYDFPTLCNECFAVHVRLYSTVEVGDRRARSTTAQPTTFRGIRKLDVFPTPQQTHFFSR